YLSTAVNTPISIDLSDKIQSADTTAGELTVISVAGTALGDVTILNNTLTYTPKPDVYGKEAFVYTVKDSHTPAHYAQGNITIEITPPPAPEITQLKVKQETAGFLRADITCAHCDTTKYQYAWIINGLTVGNNATYTPTTADGGFNIRLEVTGQDVYGQIAPMQHVTYMKVYVKKIYSTDAAFAALKDDGSVITWGNTPHGGDSNSVASKLTSGVKAIYSNRYSFAALKDDGSVITWGGARYGGDSNSVAPKLTSGVKTIYPNKYSFAALKNDGSVVTWGDPLYGGDSSSVVAQLTNVKNIYSTAFAYAALKDDGSVVTWGNLKEGGDSSSVAAQLINVKTIFSTATAFAALKNDGSVVTWGNVNSGGDSNGVAAQLTDVITIYSANDGAFAALKNDGSLVTWGGPSDGGDSSGVAARLTDMKTVYS
ncbi:MAG: Ig-like domain-containing protein, partial [Shewanella sp.]